jgi:HK97 family phage major capsid protein
MAPSTKKENKGMLTYEEINRSRIAELGRELHTLATVRAVPEGPRVDLAKLVLDLSASSVYGENREALQESARRAGVTFDPHRPVIPFAALRDLNASVAGAGGYLVAVETREPVDILRPWSITARAGVMVETGLVGDQAVPKVTAKASPNWLASETSQATPSQPTLSQIAMRPKQVTALVNFSRQLSRQANADSFVRRELSRTVGTAVDQAVLNGSGASGQPLGLYNTGGVQSQSGTTLNGGTLTMKRKSAEANVEDSRIAFISTPAVRETLEGRERATGGGRFVWDGDRVADRPAFVSTDVPTATMVCGDWSNIYFGIWGEAFQLEINPFDPSGFKGGTIQGRIILSCDVAVLHAPGFVVATSIT